MQEIAICLDWKARIDKSLSTTGNVFGIGMTTNYSSYFCSKPAYYMTEYKCFYFTIQITQQGNIDLKLSINVYKF